MDELQTVVFLMQTPIEDERPIYLGGNFNNWSEQDEAYKMTPINATHYIFEMKITPEIKFPIQYKYNKGGWSNIELDEAGELTKNRITSRHHGNKKDYVPHWARDGKSYNEDLLPSINLVDKAFFMPQLNKHRKVFALLPKGYWTSTKRYPVLYLQDGQNLFDESAPFGTWGVDKHMARMMERGIGDFIVIAIDHGGKDRISEFSPYKNFSLGHGEGRKYVEFIEQTLKPYIDTHFRTKPERESTGIGGSSMGGLISIYAGLMFPNTFGKLLIFSPSLWISPKIYFDAIEFQKALRTKIYLYAGGSESKSMIPNIRKFKEIFEKRGLGSDFIEFNLSLDSKGKHNEKQWSNEFPRAVEWLFFKD